MNTKPFWLVLIASVFVCSRAQAQGELQAAYHEQYRPQIHFSPKEKWTNDPNGMVYYKGVYHLFFQYYPGGIVWGPMHWGHAESTDLIHWKQLPIALYPDSLGYIFSGSAVVDQNNTSGLASGGAIPLVAVFTHHNPVLQKQGSHVYQNESLAYSLDEGSTWVKYAQNPVLKNPGITDFRDPKVRWYAPAKRWIMTLATKSFITFYSSPDLKSWRRESAFGSDLGGHGGVWECPDLFPLKLAGSTYWVLIVNVNPGAPNGGSGTQYFIGNFDGANFTPLDRATRWLDYGPDEYAGITWSNTGNRSIFLGWMSNWSYANQVPTKVWRNAMTVPRDLFLKKVDGKLLVSSDPVPELKLVWKDSVVRSDVQIGGGIDLAGKVRDSGGRYLIKFSTRRLSDYSLTLSNAAGNVVILGYDHTRNTYYIDRSGSGDVKFSPKFAGRFYAPRLTSSPAHDMILVIDDSSIELFADGGLSVMTCIFFPVQPLNKVNMRSREPLLLDKLSTTSLNSIWQIP